MRATYHVLEHIKSFAYKFKQGLQILWAWCSNKNIGISTVNSTFRVKIEGFKKIGAQGRKKFIKYVIFVQPITLLQQLQQLPDQEQLISHDHVQQARLLSYGGSCPELHQGMQQLLYPIGKKRVIYYQTEKNGCWYRQQNKYYLVHCATFSNKRTNRSFTIQLFLQTLKFSLCFWKSFRILSWPNINSKQSHKAPGQQVFLYLVIHFMQISKRN